MVTAASETPTSNRAEPLCTALRRGMPRESAAAALARRQALAVSESETLIRPVAAHRVLPARAADGETLEVNGFTLRVPAFAPDAGKITAVAAAACTIGPDLERRVRELFTAHRPSVALAVDRVGTQALFRLSDQTLAAIRREAKGQGLVLGAQANPGDAGIGFEQQAAVLALAGAEASGIALTRLGMLSPEKSISFLVALGPDLKGHVYSGRCARCPARERCPLR